GRIDHLLDFRYLRRGKSADLGVLVDDRLVLGKIDAEGFVVRDVALDPLNVRAELAQDFVRFRCRVPQLRTLERAHLRNVALDDELAQSHRSLPRNMHRFGFNGLLVRATRTLSDDETAGKRLTARAACRGPALVAGRLSRPSVSRGPLRARPNSDQGQLPAHGARAGACRDRGRN